MKSTIGGIVAVCLCLVLIVVVFAYVLPYCDYLQAISLADAGRYEEAYDAFLAMDGYKDSVQRAQQIFEEYKAEKFKNAAVGKTFYWGKYEQDNDLTNGPEDIEWIVLAIEDGKALLLSRCGLDAVTFHDTDEPVTWEDCTLRAWLNSQFWDKAFSDEEQARILTTSVVDDRDQEKVTEDKVYILNDDELEFYLEKSDQRRVHFTEYATAQGGHANRYNGTCWWWTRTIKGNGTTVSTIDGYGLFENFGSMATDTSVSVAPAIWIQLDT